jgi:oligopeptide/dipeptide ABC transporter ATP-binding protein
MPRLDAARVGRLQPIPGTPPSLINVPSGCAFHPRCRYADQVPGERCKTEVPAMLEIGPGHQTACHLTAAKRQENWAKLALAMKAEPEPADSDAEAPEPAAPETTDPEPADPETADSQADPETADEVETA